MLAYIAAAWTQTYSKPISRDHYLLLCDVTADMEITASSIIACWVVFTELLPGNMLIKSITISWHMSPSYLCLTQHLFHTFMPDGGQVQLPVV
jgi:hypothetical protein